MTTKERFEEKFGFVFGDDSEFGKKGEVTLDVSAIPSGKTLKDILAFVESEKAIQREEILKRATDIEIAFFKENEAPFSNSQVIDFVGKILSLLTPNHNG